VLLCSTSVQLRCSDDQRTEGCAFMTRGTDVHEHFTASTDGLPLHTIVNFPYFLCFHYTGCVWRSEGARKPHHDRDLRRNRSGGETGYIAMV